MLYPIGQILIEKLTKFDLGLLCNAYEDGSLTSIFYHELLPEDRKNRPEIYADPDDKEEVTKKVGKFYKWNVKQSRHEHAVRFTKAGLQNIIPVLAENQILHLIDIAERGLPDCYDSFKGFLHDFWPDFSWAPEKSIPEIAAVLADSRFKKIVPVLEETWGVDMEKELQDDIKEIKSLTT